jgi:hypothetical protein
MQPPREFPFRFAIEKIGDKGIGFISVLEKSNLLFDVKRVYWIHGLPDEATRGEHAHKELEQLLIAVHSKSFIEIEDRFGQVFEFELSDASTGIFIPKMMWRRIKLSKDAVLLCLCSREYIEDDYIRDYQEFKNSQSHYVS